jgi:hypothetical protein
MLNNIVNNQEQYGQQHIVQACFQQRYRMGVFLQCVQAQNKDTQKSDFLVLPLILA